ncbi:MAG TPA: NCS2 family permease [Gaiellaceae bacterium]|jgi:AGZA family xanthine/uracil permease-like MFS transporter|nr:NCS2 family permease [Gaiellaceae bacterium]
MTVVPSAFQSQGLERYFRFGENGTTLARDTVAGVTTFIVMSYIIFVNPAILSFAGVEGLEGSGLPFDGVLASTCLVAGVMSILMGLVTNRAYAIAPGLGLNAVVAFTLVATEGLGFPEAMGIVVMEGALVTALVLLGMREKVMAAIPLELKKAIAIGIGLFIAFIGLVNSGVVIRGDGTPVALADFTTWPLLVVVFGLVLTISLRAIGFRGDLLVGIVVTTAFATLVNWATDYSAFTQPGVARWPDDIVQSPNFGLVGEFSFDSFATLGIVTTIALVFSLFLADFFDTMGTLVGVGKQAGYLTKAGELPEIRRPLLVDSVAAMAGGAASASSATTYIESGAGVGAGGRTGWVSVVTGALFFPFLFFAPLIGMVPAQATAPALILVGWLMITALTEAEERAEGDPATERKLAGIDFHDLAIGLSAALTIMIMPFTYSITNGIGFGFIAYVLIRIAQGQWRRVHLLMYAAAVAFALFFLIPLLHDNLSWI